MNWLVNLIIYQAAWFACVLGGDALAWVAPVLLAVHLYLSPCRRADLLLAGALLLVGLVLDGTLKAIGFFSFNSRFAPIPLWLMGVWLTFANPAQPQPGVAEAPVAPGGPFGRPWRAACLLGRCAAGRGDLQLAAAAVSAPAGDRLGAR